jgi:hypothetical protein
VSISTSCTSCTILTVMGDDGRMKALYACYPWSVNAYGVERLR